MSPTVDREIERVESHTGNASSAMSFGVGTRAATPPSVFLMTDSFQTGGSERQFAALARALDPLRFRLLLGCIQRKGPFLDGFGEVPEFGLGGSLYNLHSIGTRLRLRRHLRSLNVAIAHAFDFYTNLTLIPAAKLAGVQVVIGSHRQIGDLLRPLESRAQMAAFRFCDAVICNSQAAAKSLTERGFPQNRIAVIGNGLPDACFAETVPALPKQAGLLRVGMIARMNSKSKNHLAFLRAAARVRDRFQQVDFVLVGDGPLRCDLEREAARLGMSGCASFLGDRRDVTAILASLDVSVMPSSSESLSNVIIESMAAGLPVVANSVGGNSELIGDDRGILTTSADDEGLADAIERLLKDASLRARLAEKGRLFAQQNFTLQHMSGRHEDLYEDLLAKKTWRPRNFKAMQPNATKRPIRVAIVAASSRYVGGQSVQADLLLNNWNDDPNIRGKFIPIDPAFPSALKWIERIPMLRTVVRAPIYILALFRGVKSADVAHIFSASYWSFFVAPAPALLVARLLGKKTVIHYHSGEARDHLRRFPSTVPMLKLADALVVPSGYLVDVFKEFGLAPTAVPNVVDTAQFSFRLRKPLRPHLFCTRGFHPYYGIDTLVRAFAEVQQSFPDAALDLIGGGPSENEIRGLVKELKLQGINFMGVASRERIAEYYNRADIFINASRIDNMPVSILEAFASGTPVVSTAPESMKYLVEHERTGLLSPPDNPSALAQNVIRVLNDGDLASSIAVNAREESERYSWNAVRERWLEIYDRLADANLRS